MNRTKTCSIRKRDGGQGLLTFERPPLAHCVRHSLQVFYDGQECPCCKLLKENSADIVKKMRKARKS